MSKVVLDASAILAYLQEEPGGEIVEEYKGNALISAVNLAEVCSRLADNGYNSVEIRGFVNKLNMQVISFDTDQAFGVGDLRSSTIKYGMSIGDRACLFLSRKYNFPAVTTNRIWKKINLDTEIRLIR